MVVALKRIKMDNESEGFPITALREIKLLKKLNHVNIIKLHEVVVSKRICFKLATQRSNDRSRVYLVFEYMEHDLGAWTELKINLDVRHIKCLMRQLLEGVNYLHTHFVMHRDIKGANLLINKDGVLKLADFGLARSFGVLKNGPAFTNRVVTLWYRAPELLLGDTQYTTAIDMWSVGCCFAEMITGKPLFPENSEGNQLHIIYELCGAPTEQSWPGVTALSKWKNMEPKKKYERRLKDVFKTHPKYLYNYRVDEAALDLLDRLLTLNPSHRINSQDSLNHKYFTTEPLPCLPKDLPKVEHDSHELEIRKRNKMANMQPMNAAAQKRVYDAKMPALKKMELPQKRKEADP